MPVRELLSGDRIRGPVPRPLFGCFFCGRWLFRYRFCYCFGCRFCGCRFIRGYPIFPRVLCFRVQRLYRIRRFILIGRFVLIGRLVRVGGLLLIRGLFNSRRRLPAEGGLRQGRGCLKIERLEAAYLNRRGNRLKRNSGLRGNMPKGNRRREYRVLEG